MSMQAVKRKQSQKSKQKQVQEQANQQRQITQQESLGVMKLLLQTGVGCITYLRGIFPERAYVDDRIDTVKIDGMPSQASRSGARIKRLERGHLEEANTLLDCLEYGVNDALEQGYLKTFMIGIYLDPDHPFQLVELYTFNFIYREIKDEDGQTSKIPDLEIRDQLRDLTISTINGAGPAGDYDSLTKSKWTVGAVREQVQTLVRSLVMSTQILSPLPRKRWLTFKLYYTPETPDDYQPPQFHHVDSEDTQFMVGTRSETAYPETDVFGKVDAGHHCMTLRMMTVIAQLPDQDELTASQKPSIPTKEEANTRPILWKAEDMVVDDECDTSFETLSERAEKMRESQPIGRLGSDGELDLFPDTQNAAETSAAGSQRHYEPPMRTVTYSLPPDSPKNFGNDGLTDKERLRRAAESDQYTMPTQSMSRVPTLIPPSLSLPHSRNGIDASAPSVHNSDISQFTETQFTHSLPQGLTREPSSFTYSSIIPSNSARARQTPGSSNAGSFQQNAKDASKDLSGGAQPGDDSQIMDFSQTERTQQSTVLTRSASRKKQVGGEQDPSSPSKKGCSKPADAEVACDCGDRSEGDGQYRTIVVQCHLCKTWKHLSCYGNLGADMPKGLDFSCYRCQILPPDVKYWTQEEETRRLKVLEEIGALCLFRRVLVIFYEDGPYYEVRPLSKRLGMTLQTAQALLHRLEDERYLIPANELADASTDSVGLLESSKTRTARTKRGKKKDLKINYGRQLKKHRIERYFTPEGGQEKDLMLNLEGEKPDAQMEASQSVAERERSLSLPEPSPKATITASKSKGRPALADISHSPRANRVAPRDVNMVPVSWPSKSIAEAAKSTTVVPEGGSCMLTPQTVGQASGQPAGSNIVPAAQDKAVTVARAQVSAAKTSYKPLFPIRKSVSEAALMTHKAPTPPTTAPQAAMTTMTSLAAVGPIPTSQQGGSKGSPVGPNKRKRDASDKGQQVQELKGGLGPGPSLQGPFAREKRRRAGMAGNIRGKNDDDEHDEEMAARANREAGMAPSGDGDGDDSATEYSTDAGR